MLKALHSFFTRIEHHFDKSGRLAKYYPAYEAFESFLFSTRNTTKKGAHIRDSLDTKRYMSIVLFALTPCLLFGIYNTGLQTQLAGGLSTALIPVILAGLKIVLPIMIVSYGVGLGVEFLFAIIRGHEINEGFLVTGMLYTLILPPTIPLWMVAVGIVFGVIIGKEVFGGSGRNFLNPALTARAFLFFTYPAYMSGEVWTQVTVAKDRLIDTFSGATALGVAAQVPVGSSAKQAILDAGYSFKDLFIGTVNGSIGETSVVCVLLGAGILLVTRVGSWRTMAGCVIGMVGVSVLFNLFAGPNTIPFLQLGPHWHFVLGSFAFAAVFMATDPVSSPHLDQSKLFYGICIGALGMVIRVANPAYPEGWMLAILLMNVFAPLIDHVNIQRRLKKRIPNVV